RAVKAATRASVETTFDALPDSSRASIRSTSTTRSAARSSVRSPDSPPPRPPKPGVRRSAKSSYASSDIADDDLKMTPSASALERLDNLIKSSAFEKGSGECSVDGNTSADVDSNINLKEESEKAISKIKNLDESVPVAVKRKDVNTFQNNQLKFTGGASAIPPENMKCNILKARLEEDYKKGAEDDKESHDSEHSSTCEAEVKGDEILHVNLSITANSDVADEKDVNRDSFVSEVPRPRKERQSKNLDHAMNNGYDGLPQKTSRTSIGNADPSRSSRNSSNQDVSLSGSIDRKVGHVNNTGVVSKKSYSTDIDEPIRPETRPPSSRKSPAPLPGYSSMERKVPRSVSSSHNASFDVAELRHRTSSQSSDVFLPSLQTRTVDFSQETIPSSAATTSPHEPPTQPSAPSPPQLRKPKTLPKMKDPAESSVPALEVSKTLSLTRPAPPPRPISPGPVPKPRTSGIVESLEVAADARPQSSGSLRASTNPFLPERPSKPPPLSSAKSSSLRLKAETKQQEKQLDGISLDDADDSKKKPVNPFQLDDESDEGTEVSVNPFGEDEEDEEPKSAVDNDISKQSMPPKVPAPRFYSSGGVLPPEPSEKPKTGTTDQPSKGTLSLKKTRPPPPPPSPVPSKGNTQDISPDRGAALPKTPEPVTIVETSFTRTEPVTRKVSTSAGSKTSSASHVITVERARTDSTSSYHSTRSSHVSPWSSSQKKVERKVTLMTEL
ncbi:unnamed protein product, partial [Candidula unifasciata]